MTVICRQLEADDRSLLSVLPSPLKHCREKLTPVPVVSADTVSSVTLHADTATDRLTPVSLVSADAVSSVTLHADTATESSNAGQYHETLVLVN